MSEIHLYTAISAAVALYAYRRLQGEEAGWTEKIWAYTVIGVTLVMVLLSIVVLFADR